MFTLTSQPLTLEIVRTLPAGALKLWQVAHFEPQASQARYQELTGYAERTIRAFTRVLEDAGLINRVVGRTSSRLAAPIVLKQDPEPDKLSPGQRTGYEQLLAMGVGKDQARDLAQACTPEAIQESIRYVRLKPQVQNRAGYLVRRLRERSKEHNAARSGQESIPASAPPASTGPVEPHGPFLDESLPFGSRADIPLRNIFSKEPYRGELQNPPNASTNLADPLPSQVQESIVGESVTGHSMSSIAVLNQVDPDPLPEKDHEFHLLAYTISAACGCDYVVQPETLREVHKLYRAGYRAEDVGWFLKNDWPQIWPGTQGEPPTLKALIDHIGHSRHLLGMASGVPAGDELLRRVDVLRKHVSGEAPIRSLDELLPQYSGPKGFSPYLEHPKYRQQALDAEAAQMEQEQREWEAYERLNCVQCQRARQVCKCAAVAAISPRVKEWWLATLGQLQGQLNKSTYDTWLGHIDLVSWDGQRLVVEVPHHYAQEWITKHLLYSMTKTFNDLMNYRDNPTGQALSIEVEVVPEPSEAIQGPDEYYTPIADGGRHADHTC